MLSLSANEKSIRMKVACVNFHVFPPRYAKTQGVNLGLEFVWSTIEAMATISDLHEMYAI
ncbi:hypothetical protein D1D44_23180 [Salmonella enterica]|nr:hypothetical protein [Salmonella enterica]